MKISDQQCLKLGISGELLQLRNRKLNFISILVLAVLMLSIVPYVYSADDNQIIIEATDLSGAPVTDIMVGDVIKVSVYLKDFTSLSMTIPSLHFNQNALKVCAPDGTILSTQYQSRTPFTTGEAIGGSLWRGVVFESENYYPFINNENGVVGFWADSAAKRTLTGKQCVYSIHFKAIAKGSADIRLSKKDDGPTKRHYDYALYSGDTPLYVIYGSPESSAHDEIAPNVSVFGMPTLSSFTSEAFFVKNSYILKLYGLSAGDQIDLFNSLSATIPFQTYTSTGAAEEVIPIARGHLDNGTFAADKLFATLTQAPVNQHEPGAKGMISITTIKEPTQTVINDGNSTAKIIFDGVNYTLNVEGLNPDDVLYVYNNGQDTKLATFSADADGKIVNAKINYAIVDSFVAPVDLLDLSVHMHPTYMYTEGTKTPVEVSTINDFYDPNVYFVTKVSGTPAGSCYINEYFDVEVYIWGARNIMNITLPVIKTNAGLANLVSVTPQSPFIKVDNESYPTTSEKIMLLAESGLDADGSNIHLCTLRYKAGTVGGTLTYSFSDTLDETSPAGVQLYDDLRYDGVLGNLPLFPVWQPLNFKIIQPDYTVQFIDHDGTVLDVQTILHGENATAPTSPTRPGYDFSGWDSDFTGVESDLVITALYTLTPVLNHYDVRGKLIGGDIDNRQVTCLVNNVPVTTTTNSLGEYEFLGILQGSNLVITASTQPGYSVLPVSIILNNLQSDHHDQDFTYTPGATTYTISGKITGTDVSNEIACIINGVRHTTQTNSQGEYEFSNIPEGANVEIIPPTRSGYTVSPGSIVINNITTDKHDQNFAYTLNSGPYYPPPRDPIIVDPPIVIDPPDPDPDPFPTLNKADHYAYLFGYPEGTIQPDKCMSREEATAVFYRLLSDESREQFYATTPPFPDVETDYWSTTYISTNANAKIIQGYPDGTFRPKGCLTRAEFVTIVMRFMEFEDMPLSHNFTDIMGHFAEYDIARATNKGWIKGYPDGSFKPNAPISRAEVATILNYLLDRRVDQQGLLQEIVIHWPDLELTHWAYYDMMEACVSHTYERRVEGEVLENWTGKYDHVRL